MNFGGKLTYNFNQKLEQKQTRVQIWFVHVNSNSITKILSPCRNETSDTCFKVQENTHQLWVDSAHVEHSQISKSKNPKGLSIYPFPTQTIDLFFYWRELTRYLVSALKSERLFSNTELVDEDTQVRHIIYLLCNHHFLTD